MVLIPKSAIHIQNFVCGPVAQLVEHRPFKAAAESSSLSRLTKKFR